MITMIFVAWTSSVNGTIARGVNTCSYTHEAKTYTGLYLINLI